MSHVPVTVADIAMAVRSGSVTDKRRTFDIGGGDDCVTRTEWKDFTIRRVKVQGHEVTQQQQQHVSSKTS